MIDDSHFILKMLDRISRQYPDSIGINKGDKFHSILLMSLSALGNSLW